MPFFWPFLFFVDKYAAILNLNLINQPNLYKILEAEVFVHSDGQLRAAHLILSYNLLSSSFQVPKCVIKAKDKRLYFRNVTVLGFLNPGPALEGVQEVTLSFQYLAKEPTPSQPTIKEEEEIVEVSDFEDFEVYNQPLSLEIPTGNLRQLLSVQVSHTEEDPTIPNAMVL